MVTFIVANFKPFTIHTSNLVLIFVIKTISFRFITFEKEMGNWISFEKGDIVVEEVKRYCKSVIFIRFYGQTSSMVMNINIWIIYMEIKIMLPSKKCNVLMFCVFYRSILCVLCAQAFCVLYSCILSFCVF